MNDNLPPGVTQSDCDDSYPSLPRRVKQPPVRLVDDSPENDWRAFDEEWRERAGEIAANIYDDVLHRICAEDDRHKWHLWQATRFAAMVKDALAEKLKGE